MAERARGTGFCVASSLQWAAEHSYLKTKVYGLDGFAPETAA